MKKIISFLILTWSVTAFAFTFAPPSQIYFDRVYGEVRFHNTYAFPIVCSGNFTGLKSSGRTVFSTMNQVRILPGMFAYLQVHTNNYEPFVRVYPNVSCVRSL